MYYVISKNALTDKALVETFDVQTEAEAWHLAHDKHAKLNDNQLGVCCLTKNEMISIKEFINNNDI